MSSKQQNGKEVYISYSWAKDSKEVAEELDKHLSDKGFRIKRDVKDSNYKSDLIGYMEKLSEGEKVIVIVSNEYLQSDNCMRELLGIHKAGRLADRIFPIVVPGTNIYKPEDRLKVLRYWEDTILSLEVSIKSGQLTNAKNIIEDLNLRKEIRDNVDEIMVTFTRLNALSLSEHRKDKFSVLEAALNENQQAVHGQSNATHTTSKFNENQFKYKEGYKEFLSGRLEITTSTVDFFSNRIRMAFSGKRGLFWINEPAEAVKRLSILLQLPLQFECNKRLNRFESPKTWITGDPIWWWRGGSSMHIDDFEVLSPTKVLIEDDECEIKRIAVFRSNDSGKEFVYVETKPDDPTGLYESNQDRFEDIVESIGYYSEEFAVLDGHYIKREEYDDGYAVINGDSKSTYGAKLRARYLTPYNFFISAKFSDLNNRDFDRYSKEILNEIVKGNTSPDSLFERIKHLPSYDSRW